jgi:O-antigen/teichoic acid export membrane protein
MTAENIKNKPLLPLFIKGEVSQRFFNLLSNGIGFINSYFIITYLSVYQFGLYQLVLSFISILSTFDLDLFDGVISVDMRRHFNTGKDGLAKRLFREAVFLRIGIALVLVAIVFLLSGVISDHYGSDISLFVKIASFLLIIKAFQSVLDIFFQAVLSFSIYSLALIREFIKLFFIVGLVLLNSLTITSVIACAVITEFLALVFFSSFFFVKKYRNTFGKIKMGNEDYGHPVKNILKDYGAIFLVRYSVSRILKNMNPWIVKFFLNVEAVAFYVLAVNLISFANSLIPMVGIQSVLALKADERENMGHIVKRAIKYTFWIGLVFLFGAIFIVPYIAALIFPKYVSAMPVFKVMAIALPLFGAFKVLKSSLFVLREQRILTQRLFNELFITLVCSVIFLPTIGVIGMGVIHVLVYSERVYFMYTRLVRAHSEFKMKIAYLFSFDKYDRDFFQRTSRTILSTIKKSS